MEIETGSTTWLILTEIIEREVKSLRDELESETTDWDRTCLLRGQILAYRRVITQKI